MIDQEGLFLIDGDGDVVEIHTSSESEDDLGALAEYLDEWDLEVPDL